MLAISLFSSCKEKPLAPDEMKDAAGNRYKTVTIGAQVWMAENLNALYTNKSNSSSYLTDVVGADFWYPDDNPATMLNYGLLYPFEGAKTLLPKGGWRIPTLQDIDILLHELGVNYDTGGNAVVHALNINIYPGSNAEEFITIDKYFSLLLDEPPKSIAFDYLTLRIHARDYPDDDIYRKTLYTYNASKGFASSVRFVKDIE
jgi:uncharacterized protein (TIGR02145 family)